MNKSVRLVLAVAGVALCMIGLYIFGSSVLGSRHAAAHEPAGTIAPAAAPTSGAGGTAAASASAGPTSADPSVSTTSPELATAKLTMRPLAESDEMGLLGLAPQQQAEKMMMAAVNHYEGATKLVEDHVQSWRGQIKKTPEWDNVELEARYSSDLRVRDAAIDVDLVMNQLDKNSDTVDRLISDAQANAANRGFDFTMLGMLANRDVEIFRVHSALRDWAHDPDETTRYWAIEGLAYLGTEDTIPDFLEVFRNDPTLKVRERCGASLAKSGMLTREQRMRAVPGLIEIAADSSQDPTTRAWAFQALREITAHQAGNDVGVWKTWFSAHGSERAEEFHRGDPNAVLGNS
ncbi:MAG TPA: HEAT repeat domain-containing protein [Candidatus Angelobacter sp.]|jgi:hypothetical protein